MVLMAREAWGLIRRASQTPFRILTLIICVPIMIEPVYFTFVFGTYDGGIPDSFYALGMLRMLSNSLANQADRSATHTLSLERQKVRRSGTPEHAYAVRTS